MLNVLNSRLRGYSVAALIVALALLLNLLLKLQIELESPFLLFFPAVMFSSWYGGLGPGVLATLLTGLLSYYCFVDPNYSLLFSSLGQTLPSDSAIEQTLDWQLLPGQILQLGLYILEGLLLSSFLGVFRFPKRELEPLVRDREASLVSERSQLIPEQTTPATTQVIEQRSAFLAQASTVLASSLDYETTLTSVAHLAVPFLADYCLIHRLEKGGQLRYITAIHQDPDKQKLTIKLARFAQTYIQNPQNFLAQVLRTGKAMLFSEFSDVIASSISQDDRLLAISRELDPKSVMIVPLVSHGQLLGTITLATAESNRRYDAADLALAEDLAHRAALAIDNAQLYRDTQQALQHQAELLSLIDALLAASPLAVGFLDRELRYIRINQVLASINGFSVEEHLGRRFREVLPEMALRFEPQLQQVLDTGEPMLNVEISGEAPGKPGQYGYWLGNYYPVRDTDGQTVGIGIILANITATKQAEATVREANHKVVTILESITDAFFALNRDWQFTYVNHRCAELMRSSPEQLLGQCFWEVFPDTLGTILDEQYHRVVDEQTPAHFEVTGLFTGRWFEVHAHPSTDGIAVYFHEISDRKRAQEALRQSEEHLRLVVQNMPVMLDAFDADWNIIVWNRECERITGYSAQEMIGNPHALELLYPDAAYRERMFAEHLARDQNYRDWEWDITCKDGSIKTIAWSNICKQFPIPGWVTWGVGVDVTERKQAQAALKDSEERFRAMFNQAAVGIAQVALDGRFIQVNPALCEITGYSPDELTQMTFQDVTHPDDLEPDLAEAERVLAGEINGYSLEKRYIRKDGCILWINLTSSVVRDSGGQPKYAVGIIEDISDRKRAEIAQQFLVEASTLLAASLDYETTLTNVAHLTVPNLADCCIVDIFQEDWSIRPLAIAATNSATQELYQELRHRYPPTRDHLVSQRLRSGQSSFQPEMPDSLLVAFAQDDEHLQLLRRVGISSAMAIPLRSHGQVFGSISFIRIESSRRYNQADLALGEDIARRAATAIDNARLYREAQEANRLKDEFLAVLSHELRSPINAIVGWSQMLRTRKLNQATIDRALETIERNAKLQTQLIEDLLDISRIIQGKLYLKIHPLNLASVIEAAINTVRPAAEAKGIQLQSQLTSAAELISGDANRLQQVVWNLLSNAIKFTPQGGRVEIRLDHTNSHIQIQVADTGKGIRSDFLPYVFDRFRQADSSITRSHGGLGLGLSIVRQLVELHGGTVQAESPGEGQGATFIVKLPLVTESSKASENGKPAESRFLTSSSPHSLTPSPPQPLTGLRILVVDDEIDTREYLLTVLEDYGAEAIGVASVSQAILEIKHLLPDVLVSDIGMPGKDGYSLIRKVRALELDQGAEIPAVAVTAYAGEEDREQAIAAGFQMHISKPIEPTQLVSVVASLARQIQKS